MGTEGHKVNGSVAIRWVPVSCRYPEDRIALLDTVQKRLGVASRSDIIRYALDRLVNEHIPGAIGGSA